MSEFVTVDIPQGKLRGKKVTSSTNGVTYFSFQGIPYAKPPVGPLRFKPPEDPEPWTGTRDATVEGSVCPQVDLFTGKLIGDDDCLFLNVYTPQLSASSPKAVMVWIHGGGYIFGSGSTELYGPDFLIAEDVVVVTLNYRFGALGFLYLDGCDVTGSNGLRDQVMALKWVKNNIARFGGNPSNVTIFGESAGGVSVHYLMLSPLAEGLFHRAIPQSGTALLFGGGIPRDISNQRTVRLAKVFGCTSEDPQEVVDFLRAVPALEIVAHQWEALAEDEKHRVLYLPFAPCDEIGSDAFLPDSVRNLLRDGRYTKVPSIHGVTSGEGKVLLMEAFRRTTLSELDKHIENILPMDIAPRLVERSKEIARLIKKYYFGDSHVGDDTVLQYLDMMSDLAFLYPLQLVVQSQVKWSSHPTYVYLFDYVNESRYSILTRSVDDIPGAAHGTELQYLFSTSPKLRDFKPGSPDAQVQAALIQLWTQFAKTGKPSSDLVNVTWTPATEGSLAYLKMDGGYSMDSDMYKSRVDFIEEVYKFLPQAIK